MADVLYVAQGSSNTTSDLYTANPATGVTTAIGPIGCAMTALAFDPTSGILYGATSSNSTVNPNCLITINISTGAGTLVGAFGTNVPDMDFTSAGLLYGVKTNVANKPLVSINKATGAVSTVGTPGFRTGTCAIDVTDVCYMINNDFSPPHLETINLSTAAGTDLGVITSGTGPQGATSFDSAHLLWFTDNAFFSPNLYSIDVLATRTETYNSSLDREIDAIAWLRGGGGDTTPPVLVPPIVGNNYTVTLTYDEPLANTVSPSSFSLLINGSPASVTAASVSGSQVFLTVSPAIRPGDVVSLSYLG